MWEDPLPAMGANRGATTGRTCTSAITTSSCSEDYLRGLPAESLRLLSGKLLADLKEAHDWSTALTRPVLS
jgi:hypothetical protein